MMRRILSFLFLCLPMFSWAQNEMQTINSIKSDLNFLYAQGTSQVSAEDATEVARELIGLEIEQWLKERSVNDAAGYLAKAKESLSQINTRRGNLYRAFVFVKKQDVLPYNNEEKVIVVDFQRPVDAQTPQDSMGSQTQPVTQPAQPPVAVTPVSKPTFVPTDGERNLLNIQSFNALNEFINQGRQSGTIVGVGNYKTLPKDETCYVFIHNREGEIPAHLKWQNAKALNMVTGSEDAITNYKGCGAIWIKLKSE